MLSLPSYFAALPRPRRHHFCADSDKGYFKHPKMNTLCTACRGEFSGADCASSGSTLTTLVVKPGHWRAHQTSDDIRKCPVSEYCLGGNDTDVLAQCGVGHVGPYCSLCEDGWYLGLDTGCAECVPPTPRVYLVSASIFVATLLGILLLRKLLDFMSDKLKARLNTVVKVLFVFSQILVQFPSIFGVRFPSIFANMLDWLSVPTLSFSFTTGIEW